MDTLFLFDNNPDSTITSQVTVDSILEQTNEQFLLARQDLTSDLLSEDPEADLFADATRDITSGGGGGGSCPACNEVFKILFTNVGDVVLLGDGRIATGRY